MSTKPMKPIGKQKQQQVDLSQAETLKCEYCNNVLFISSTIIKRYLQLFHQQDKKH